MFRIRLAGPRIYQTEAELSVGGNGGDGIVAVWFCFSIYYFLFDICYFLFSEYFIVTILFCH